MMLPFDTIAAIVLTRLLRPGEESTAAWPIDARSTLRGALDLAVDAWTVFVVDRYATWQATIDSGLADGMEAGWVDAAVRLFGDDAVEALAGLKVPPWAGQRDAEDYLLEMASDLRVRKAWERV